MMFSRKNTAEATVAAETTIIDAVPVVAPGEEVEIALELVDPSPHQPRSRSLTKKDVEELAAAIRSHGQLQAILVSPSETTGRYIVHSGHRRCAALRYLGQDTVRAIVRELSEREAQRIVVGDNLGRKDLSAMEKAIALKNYTAAYELELAEAATELGVRRTTAYRLKALLDASTGLQEIFEASGMPARPAAALAKIEASNPRKAERLAHKYCDGKVTADELEKIGKKSKQVRSATRARKVADLKASDREVRLTINLTKSAIDVGGAAVDEAVEALGRFLGHIGRPAVEAIPVHDDDVVTGVA